MKGLSGRPAITIGQYAIAKSFCLLLVTLLPIRYGQDWSRKLAITHSGMPAGFELRHNLCGEGACSRSAAKQSQNRRMVFIRQTAMVRVGLLRSPAGASSLATDHRPQTIGHQSPVTSHQSPVTSHQSPGIVHTRYLVIHNFFTNANHRLSFKQVRSICVNGSVDYGRFVANRFE